MQKHAIERPGHSCATPRKGETSVNPSFTAPTVKPGMFVVVQRGGGAHPYCELKQVQ